MRLDAAGFWLYLCLYIYAYIEAYSLDSHMLATKPTDIRNNQKDYFDRAYDGETVVVTRPGNRNVYVLGEREYNELVKEASNAAYLRKLDRSFEQIANGDVVVKSPDELADMAR